MPAQLRIAKSGATNAPTLPLDAVTSTFGVLGQRGTGKTNTAVVMVEEMAKHGGHAAIFDPVGAWYGITHAGEKKGIEGIVIGGEHGDVPLEEEAGQLVAELVIGRHWPVVVIDLKMLRKGAQLRFMADCLEVIFHANREPLHIVFEEADRALPQMLRQSSDAIPAARVLGAGEDIVKLGRSRGLGATLVTQRPATLNKNVLEVCESLLLHRLMGPNDRKAVKAWVEANGDERALKQVMDSMASLARGEAWLYSPGFLGLLERVRIRGRHTFDSSATPRVGERVAEPTARAPVDLDELRARMAETVKRQRENDPDELRARIEELEQQLEDGGVVDAEVVQERVLVPDREAMAELSEAAAAAEVLIDELRQAEAEHREREQVLVASIEEHQRQWATVLGAAHELLDTAAALPPDGRTVSDVETRHPTSRTRNHESRIVKGEGGLNASTVQLVEGLTRFYPLWLDRGQLALLLGRGKNSSTLTQQLAEAVSAGALERNERGRYRVVQPENGAKPPSVRELRDRFREALPDGPRALFDVLLRATMPVERASLFEAAGFSPTSSTPVGHLKLLKDNGLAEQSGGAIALGPAVR